MHGQICINALIESILALVDIPLTLQEIEGDAVFLYAADPGPGGDWPAVLEEVSRKLDRFAQVFITESGVNIESTPCGCAICRNADQLGLKIVVHAGEAVFHELADAAHQLMGAHLPGSFEPHAETYEGFDRVDVWVRDMTRALLDARDAVYALPEPELRSAVRRYLGGVGHHLPKAALQQMRRPIRPFSAWQRACMLLDVLAEAGAKEIWGVTGDVINLLLEAIRNDGRFRGVGVRHEENAGYAASAQAQMTGAIGGA